jgi:hypothetical protein
MRTASIMTVGIVLAGVTGASLLFRVPGASADPMPAEPAAAVAPAAPRSAEAKLDGSVRSAVSSPRAVAVVIHLKYPVSPESYTELERAGVSIERRFPEIACAQASLPGTMLQHAAEVPSVTRIAALIDTPEGQGVNGLIFPN